jgi:hypothetical protein
MMPAEPDDTGYLTRNLTPSQVGVHLKTGDDLFREAGDRTVADLLSTRQVIVAGMVRELRELRAAEEEGNGPAARSPHGSARELEAGISQLSGEIAGLSPGDGGPVLAAARRLHGIAGGIADAVSSFDPAAEQQMRWLRAELREGLAWCEQHRGAGAVLALITLLEPGAARAREALSALPSTTAPGGGTPSEVHGAVYHDATQTGIIQTADGLLILHAGYSPVSLPRDDVRFATDLAAGRAAPAGEAWYEPRGYLDERDYGSPELTITAPGGRHISIAGALHAAPLNPGGDPLGCLARAIGADDAPAGPGQQPARARDRRARRGTSPAQAPRRGPTA